MKEDVLKRANEISAYLTEHNCKDVQVIDLGEHNSIADYFVVATVTSVGHLKGVAHQLWSKLHELNMEVSNRHKSVSEDGWTLVDCGDIVIHLMSEELRAFYSLEKLWEKTASL